jgi:hypothetical protein
MTRPVPPFGRDFADWVFTHELKPLFDGIMTLPAEQRPPLIAPLFAVYTAWKVRQPASDGHFSRMVEEDWRA